MRPILTPFEPFGEIIAPPSKSIAHRTLIAAALTKGESLLKNVGVSDDVKATARCLSSLGAKVEFNGRDAFVRGIDNPNIDPILDCGESGTTLRFLLPIAAALGVNARFVGSKRLFSRPLGNLLSELERGGARGEDFSFYGRLKSGEYSLDCSQTSQIAGGMLLALPLLDGKSELRVGEKIPSRSYLDLTYRTLDLSGIKYKKSADKTIICGKQDYRLPPETVVGGDWSAAAVILALGAIGGRTRVRGLSFDDGQGDRKIIDVLRSFGADVETFSDGAEARKSRMKGTFVDCSDIPDLVPVLCALACYAEGESVFSGVERLKGKESDRLSGCVRMANAVGAKSEVVGDLIKITSNGSPRGANFQTDGDHRMVMAAVALSSGAWGNSTASDGESVSKSYPDFFDDLKILANR